MDFATGNNTIDNKDQKGERVTSTYADLYFNDNNLSQTQITKQDTTIDTPEKIETEWISPSDTLIGIIELQPPFTSKITRGQTHEGILAIGDKQLQKDQERFTKYINKLINDNDSIWQYILDHEKDIIKSKVKIEYQKEFINKSKIMNNEMNEFYAKSLQELENHLRSEIKHVLIGAHANLIKDMDKEIKNKISKELKNLEKCLKSNYIQEMNKIIKYYQVLIENEKQKNSEMIHSFAVNKNDALKAFYSQIEANNATSTMYIMCRERKRCRIKKLLLEKYHSNEYQQKLRDLKRKQEILKSSKHKENTIKEVNEKWEERIKKILELFLKFISFSLKLLPEQSSFLFDFRKLVMLQLNEIIKSHEIAPTLLLDMDDMKNSFEFPNKDIPDIQCTDEPFVIEGDTSPTPPKIYGSTETLPSDVDLPVIVYKKNYIYAKCHNFEEIKCHNFEEIERKKILKKSLDEKCNSIDNIDQTNKLSRSTSQSKLEESIPIKESLNSKESFSLDEFQRFKDCPGRKCQNWIKAKPFPDLESYLDFSEDNFRRITTKFEHAQKLDLEDEPLKPNEIAELKPLFFNTSETFFNVATQYSSQEEIISEPVCPCINIADNKHNTKHISTLSDAFLKRKISLRGLIQENPTLLNILTDETYDFQY